MQCPTAQRQSGSDLVSSRHSLQRTARCFCSSVMDRLALLTGGWPRSLRRIVTAARDWSRCRACRMVQNEGFARQTRRLKAWFQLSNILFVQSVSLIVASWMFHFRGSNGGGMRRTLIVFDASPCRWIWRAVPVTYVASKYVSSSIRVSWFSSDAFEKRYCIPSETWSTGRNANASIIQQKCLTTSLSQYDCARPKSWIFLHVLWHKWKKHPRTSTWDPERYANFNTAIDH